MRNNRFTNKLKSILSALLVAMLCVTVSPLTAAAEDSDDTSPYNDGNPDNYIKDVKISNLSFYDDGSLKSFDIAVTPACAKYDDFDEGTAHGAISIHAEKFGAFKKIWDDDILDWQIVNEDPTGDMEFYLYNGPDDAYRWKDAVCYDGSVSESYWENYLYQDYSCSKIGAMATSRPIESVITWNDVPEDEQFPQDCYFVSWGLDENGDAQLIDLTIGENEYATTKETMYFTKGKIIPSEEQVFYVYLWNQWSMNTDEYDNLLFSPTEYCPIWWNPTGIYPDRYIFTLNTGHGILPDSVTDTLEISGETTVGKTLSADIRDKDNIEAAQYWKDHTWSIDGEVVGTGLTYEVKAENANKAITFTCEGESGGRTGLLMNSVTIFAGSPVYPRSFPADPTDVTTADSTDPTDPVPASLVDPTEPESNDSAKAESNDSAKSDSNDAANSQSTDSAKPDNAYAVATGDRFSIILWLILAAASMIGILTFTSRRRTAKQK